MELNKVVTKLEKSKIKAGDGKKDGNYPLFTCSPTVNKYYDEFLYDTEAIILSTGGNPVINYYNGKFAYSTDCLAIKTNNEIEEKYLYYYLISRINKIEKMFRGVGIKHLNKNEFFKLNIKFPQIKVQEIVVDELDNLQSIIDIRKKQIQQFDELIKSQFVEMFGSVKNSKWNIEKLENITEKITDGKHGGCQSEDNSGYYFIGATEIYNDKINYENANQITKKDFEKDYTRCDLQIDDLVIVNTGATIGKSAIVVDERCHNTLLQKSVALIRAKKEKIQPIYLKYCYEEEPSLYSKGQGCARINLLLSQIRNTDIPIPPIELQNKFAEFVKQVDKQKFEIQKSLEEMQLLKESLMDKYFG